MTLHYSSSKILIIFFLFLFFGALYGQDKRISITSNIIDALVKIDSGYIGNTPIINYPVSKKMITLSVYDENPDTWSVQKFSIILNINKDTTLRINFKKKVKIISKPDNAAVFLNNSLIGYTPVCFIFDSCQTNIVKIIKENYREISFPADTLKSNILEFELKKNVDSPQHDEIKNNNGFISKNNLNYFIIGGIASGLLSGYTKMRADDFEKEYDNNKSESAKNKVYTYDTISNISLVIFECCLITVNYLLLKD